MTAHTPTPWENRIFEDRAPFVVGGNGQNVLSSHRLSSEVEANVRLIVRAVNAHAALVEALKDNRLMMYAWKAARANMGLPDDHSELNATIARMEAALARARE